MDRRKIVVAAAALSAMTFGRAGAQPKLAPAPSTHTDAASDVYHGVTVVDPYRWLEAADDPAVKAWSDAQNVRTRAYLDAIPARPRIKAELTRLIKAGSPAYSGLSAQGGHVFARYADPARQQPMLVEMNGQADPASRRTVLDPNTLDPSGHTEIDWWVASPDGSKVAVSLSRNGSEDGVLHIYATADGREVGAPIPRVQYPTAGGSLAWTPDGQAFWYTRYPGEEAPETERHFNMSVYVHRLGTDWRGDRLALGRKDGLERVSEVFLDNRNDQPAVVALVQRGDGGQFASYLLRHDAPALQLSTYEDQVVFATFGPDGALYGVSHKGAPDGKVMKAQAPFAAGALAQAPVIVPEAHAAIRNDGIEEGVAALVVSPKRLFVRDLVGGPSQVRVFDHDGRPMGLLPVPPVADIGDVTPLADGAVLYDVETYLKPRRYLRFDTATGQASETGLAVTAPFDFDDAEVRRVFATSRDGTQIPLNVIMKRGTALDGRNPVLLYGYGGYGISMTPAFAGSQTRMWLDEGGIFVVANVRGGAEFGERWHAGGALLNKQNVFDDFDAAGVYLISQRYTSHARLALMGESNGGLLMGATLTQHPELARAVVSRVGIYDMLRVELDPNGAFNTTEFGSVKDPAQFRALYAYSPYQHVDPGVRYPAVLMTTGANDGRVNPMQSRKFAARLQADTASGLPVLLRTSVTSGHGMGSSLADRIDELADIVAFLTDQLNMTAPD